MTQLSFSDPPAQRHSGTSVAAARAIKAKAPSLRERVYYFIMAHGPVTDQEIAEGLGLDPSTARPRRIELVAAGKVRCHHETRRTASGHAAHAWVTCEPF